MNNIAFDLLVIATADIRFDYVARFSELRLAQLVRDREELAKVGMDAQIYAPYPSGNMDRTSFKQAEARHYRIRSYFQSDNASRGFRHPDPVTERPDAEPRLRQLARQEADALVDSYLHKMVKKIGKEITSAETNGRIWDCATLTVTCLDGDIQVWDTKCILNVSCLGKVFNQWPTRRVS